MVATIKFDIPATVKDTVKPGADIENTASQLVHYYNPSTKKVEKPVKPTEKRVNSIPIDIEFNFTKKLEGRELQAGEFSFVLKDSKGTEIETVQNDKEETLSSKPLSTRKAKKALTSTQLKKLKDLTRQSHTTL